MIQTINHYKFAATHYSLLLTSPMDQRFDIKQFIAGLSEIPSSDPLVDVAVSKRGIIVVEQSAEKKWTQPLDAAWNRVLRTALQNKRESDLDSLCFVQGCVSWKYKNKTVVSPLLLFPVSWKIRKADGTVELAADTEAAFINPFVNNRLLRDFDLNLAEICATETATLYAELLKLLVLQPGIEVGELFVIGNFHHHRYQILRELELLGQADPKSDLVETILGNETASNSYDLQLSRELLTAADADQLKVFEQISSSNTVIQGPPGTGKSQVLLNVLGKSLAAEGLTLVVSEKRTALEVLVRKMKDAGLEAFTFLVHSQTKPRDFIRKLKATWSALEEEYTPVAPSLLLSEQLKAQLQLTLDKLNMPTLVGGVSFTTFRQLLRSSTVHDPGFRSDVPGIDEWLRALPDLEAIRDDLGSFDLFAMYKQPLFSTAQFDAILSTLDRELQFFRTAFQAETLADLEKTHAAAARCQLIANESFKAYYSLHTKPKELKRFYKLQRSYETLRSRLELLKGEIRVWKQAPSYSQAASWKQQLSRKQSWLAKRRLLKTIRSYLADPAIGMDLAIDQWLAYFALREEQIAMERRFAEWGIQRPELELESAAYVLRQLEKEDPNELNRLQEIPLEKRKLIIGHAQRLQQLLQDLRRYCNLRPDSLLSGLITPNVSEALLPHLQRIHQLPPAVYRLLAGRKTLAEMQAIVLHSNWLLTEARFPELSKFDGELLKAKLEAILATEEAEFSSFAASLRLQRKHRFEGYAQLLRTPAARLKPEQRSLKATLKAGKALLVKEFGKTKQHRTIRELLSSEARTWIELLTPVWLSTPARVAETFPMERALFNLLVFDESSQTPLPNSLGAMQRAVRAVVAGDEQQMAPASYFSGGKAGVDLLHQASYYWTKVPLKHHYRSVHPALIAFSNRHFYNNELVTYPSPGSPFPLHRHFVEAGIYEDRTNLREAEEVAAFLTTISWEQTVGIAAFSLQQLGCIRAACSVGIREKIADGQEKGTVFFKALEHIQGDECDLLIVSMGYGRNAEDEFHLRLGPLNQRQGYKRLNVLLTRARKELHFFTSVHSRDLAVSANESINLLRLFLQQLERPPDESSLQLPYGLVPETITDASLTLPAVYAAIPLAQELVTFHRVMKARGWKVSYT